ncbi:MAG TPA: hypothetical protein VK002_11460 [Rubricoccaceae bacterium]|nr:hypothetical protein [Rubricoccaceae bacterium]
MDVHLDPAMKVGERLRGRDVLLASLDAKGAVLRAMEPAPCLMLR